MKSLKLDLIKTDAGTQSRVCITDDVVADYAERMEEGDKFPPVIVFHDGADYFLADGFHRCLAARRNGFVDILADVRTGARLDALWFSLGANMLNGLRRTNSDKQRCVILALENFTKESDRRIADACGVSTSTVSKHREELEQLSKLDSSSKRIGKDGKTRNLPKARPATPEPAEPPTIKQPRTPEPASAAPAKAADWIEAWDAAKQAIAILGKVSVIDENRDAAFDEVKCWIQDQP